MADQPIIVLTGVSGMIGYHLRCHLLACGHDRVFCTEKSDLQSVEAFQSFLEQLPGPVGFVVHCAGVNRPDDPADFAQNEALAHVLTTGVGGQSPSIIYLNTIQSTLDNPYGRSKKKAAEIFAAWAQEGSGVFHDLVLPNVFGEYTKPFYNSVVATFSQKIMQGETPTIIEDKTIQFIHASQVCEKILAIIAGTDYLFQPRKIQVSGLLDMLNGFYETYVQGHIFPAMPTFFERQMFNTFRSYAPGGFYQRALTKHTDDRGWLIETVKADCGGQGFTSLSKPGVIRGNHFHLHKIERFLVLSGQADIQIRRLFTDEIQTLQVDGETPCVVDIPTLCTHNIHNTGSNNMLAQFWSDEIFDPDNPDTYRCDLVDGIDQKMSA